jgi:hypothetical protein
MIRLTKAQQLRAELEHLRARYDGAATPPAVYATIKAIEVKLAWSQYHQDRMAAEREAR